MKVTISEINIYPIKSTAGISMVESEVQKIGLWQDRRRAVVSSATNRILTARDCPQLLALSTKINGDELLVNSPNSSCSIPMNPENHEIARVKLWANEAHPGVRFSKEVDDWFSEQLNLDCYLIYMNENCRREFPTDMPSGYVGLPEDSVSYADDYPILLASEASLSELNSRLKEPVTMKHFRPNIVLSGSEAFEEDTWGRIRIGECEFELAQQCPRCVMTTINPETQQKHPQQEPLRTLAAYRRSPSGGAPFGVQLVPRRLGTIRIGDTAEKLG
jgi:uncharacterized protein YcbX